MSRRILIMTDDYNENLRVETILRKVGFDVISLQSETQMDNEILSFRPELILAAGQTSKLSPVSVGTKLRKHRTYSGSVILGFPAGVRLGPEDLMKVRVDNIVEYPFDIHKLIDTVSVLLKVDGQQLLEKLKRFSAEIPERQTKRPEKRQPTTREQKYTSFLKGLDIDPTQTTFVKSEIKEKWGQVRKSWDQKALENLRDLKEQFVKALFTGKEKK